MRSTRRPLSGPTGDDGSTIPLILGFFVIALMLVAGAVMASDAFTKQRDLQSICDGTALAAANALDTGAARSKTLTEDLPLAAVQQAADGYLAEDPARAAVSADAQISPDGATVLATCHAHTHLAFGGLIGHPGGIDQTANATARGVLG